MEGERQLKYNEESREGALRDLLRFYGMRVRKEYPFIGAFFGFVASL